LDVHKETIAVGIVSGERSVGRIPDHLQAADTLIKKLQKLGEELRFCDKAGPCGYPLYRFLRGLLNSAA